MADSVASLCNTNSPGFVKAALDSKSGCSFVESHPCLWKPAVVTTGSSEQMFPINVWDGGFGCGCGSMYGGGWNGGLFRFSDIIEDRNEVSFWDSFSAGMKESLYVNPMGTLGQGLQLVGVGSNLIGGLCNAGSGLLDFLSGINKGNGETAAT